jgi:hypothetical protein
MSASFELPITYQGKDLFFPAELVPKGYSYQIKVVIDDVAVFFEPDEEKNYRALSGDIEMKKSDVLDKDLLQQISETLYSLFA